MNKEEKSKHLERVEWIRNQFQKDNLLKMLFQKKMMVKQKNFQIQKLSIQIYLLLHKVKLNWKNFQLKSVSKGPQLLMDIQKQKSNLPMFLINLVKYKKILLYSSIIKIIQIRLRLKFLGNVLMFPFMQKKTNII